MELVRIRLAQLRLGRMLRAWRAEVRAVELPEFDPSRVDAAARELRARGGSAG